MPYNLPSSRDRLDLNDAELAEQYRQGAAVRAIAAQKGVSYGTIHFRLWRAGVVFRPRGGRRPDGNAKP